jgi:hypothetical protein
MPEGRLLPCGGSSSLSDGVLRHQSDRDGFVGSGWSDHQELVVAADDSPPSGVDEHVVVAAQEDAAVHIGFASVT